MCEQEKLIHIGPEELRRAKPKKEVEMAEDKLLTEIDTLLRRLCDKIEGSSHPSLLVRVHREEILAKIREVVEGAGLTPEEIGNITENIALSYIGEKARNAKEGDFEKEVRKALVYHQFQAILKAIGGE